MVRMMVRYLGFGIYLAIVNVLISADLCGHKTVIEVDRSMFLGILTIIYFIHIFLSAQCSGSLNLSVSVTPEQMPG